MEPTKQQSEPTEWQRLMKAELGFNRSRRTRLEWYCGVQCTPSDLKNTELKHQIHAMVLEAHGLVDSHRVAPQSGTALPMIDGKPVFHDDAQEEAGQAIIDMQPTGTHFETEDGMDDEYVWSRRGRKGRLIIKRRSRCTKADRVGLEAFTIKYAEDVFVRHRREVSPERERPWQTFTEIEVSNGRGRRAVFAVPDDEDDDALMLIDPDASEPISAEDVLNPPPPARPPVNRPISKAKSQRRGRPGMTPREAQAFTDAHFAPKAHPAEPPAPGRIQLIKSEAMAPTPAAHTAQQPERVDRKRKQSKADEIDATAETEEPPYKRVKIRLLPVYVYRSPEPAEQTLTNATVNQTRAGKPATTTQSVSLSDTAKSQESTASKSQRSSQVGQDTRIVPLPSPNKTMWKHQPFFDEQKPNARKAWELRAERLRQSAALDTQDLTDETEGRPPRVSGILHKLKELGVGQAEQTAYLKTGTLPKSSAETQDGVATAIESLVEMQQTTEVGAQARDTQEMTLPLAGTMAEIAASSEDKEQNAAPKTQRLPNSSQETQKDVAAVMNGLLEKPPATKRGSPARKAKRAAAVQEEATAAADQSIQEATASTAEQWAVQRVAQIASGLSEKTRGLRAPSKADMLDVAAGTSTPFEGNLQLAASPTPSELQRPHIAPQPTRETMRQPSKEQVDLKKLESFPGGELAPAAAERVDSAVLAGNNPDLQAPDNAAPSAPVRASGPASTSPLDSWNGDEKLGLLRFFRWTRREEEACKIVNIIILRHNKQAAERGEQQRPEKTVEQCRAALAALLGKGIVDAIKGGQRGAERW